LSSQPQPGRGWQARLALRFEAGASRTLLAAREHVGPLLVQRPFYPEGEPCHVYVIHPPGGVAGGDELTLEVEARPGAHALLTTPAAGKFYRRAPAGGARVQQTLRADGAVLEWLPQENIFYPDAAVELHTVAYLTREARCIGWEIGCVGLPASAQDLAHGELRLRLELWRDGQPLLLERLNIDEQVLTARAGLAGHVAFGTALACPAGQRALECARAALAGADCAELQLACTLLDGVLLCRATARRTDRLKQAFVRWWQAVRPCVLAREAVAPRIWST